MPITLACSGKCSWTAACAARRFAFSMGESEEGSENWRAWGEITVDEISLEVQFDHVLWGWDIFGGWKSERGRLIGGRRRIGLKTAAGFRDGHDTFAGNETVKQNHENPVAQNFDLLQKNHFTTILDRTTLKTKNNVQEKDSKNETTVLSVSDFLN
jgi:hypothetical protein